MAQRVKDLCCHCCGRGSIPGLGNFHVPWAWPKKKSVYIRNLFYLFAWILNTLAPSPTCLSFCLRSSPARW